MNPTLSLLVVLALPGAVVAHTDISLPIAQVAATPLPAAPLGQGAWQFQVEAGWAKLPTGVSLGPTHGGVGVDRAGNIYVSSDGPEGILVFEPGGKYLRGLGADVSGIHGFTIRREGNREYIYGTRPGAAEAVKLGLDGKIEWKLGVPRESGVYEQPADPAKKPVVYRPTAIALGPDGRIYVADGYGASVIHVYSPDRVYQKTIGTKGTGEGQFSTCHGLTLDTRYGAPRLLVADRANRRLVHLDLEGKWLGVLTTDLRLPCAISIHGDVAAVAELEGRVVVVDKHGKVVATLGDNPDKNQWAKFKLEPQHWQDGIFIAPHGVSFDSHGNLFVQDWNFAGRFTKLKKSPARKS